MIFIIIGVLSTSLAVCGLSINKYKDSTEKLLGEKASIVADIVAKHIDGDKYEKLATILDANDNYYLETQKWMYDLKESINVLYLYTMVKKDKNQYMYIIDGSNDVNCDELSSIGDLDELESSDIKILKKVLDNGEVKYSNVQQCEWGKMITGYAPIKNSKEEIIGFVGCDVSANELYEMIKTYTMDIFLLSIFIVVIIILAIIFIIKKMIISPIKDVSKISYKVANYDLSIDVPNEYTKRKDEIGELSVAIQTVKENLKNMIIKISKASQQITASSEEFTVTTQQSAQTSQEIAQGIDEIAKGASEQAQTTTEGAEEIFQLGEFIENNQHNLSELNDVSEKVGHLVDVGLSVINTLSNKTIETNNATSEVSDRIIKTNKSSMKISEASNLITSIAEQTNLLSLNAAIEAARAGEQGKGFAVVAEEIRKLAEQSTHSTKIIDEMVKELQDNSSMAVKTMKKVGLILKEQVDNVNITEEKYNEIAEVIKKSEEAIEILNNAGKKMEEHKNVVSDKLQDLSSVAEENAAGTEEVSASIEQQSAGIQEISSSSEELEKLAQEMQKLIEKFSI